MVERRRSTRWFELDYRCAVSGDHLEAHRVLGALLQLLVDHDVVPQQHVPAELAPSNVPISVHVITDYQKDVAAGVAIRAVVPVRPTADRELAPPATSLHLDVAPDRITADRRAQPLPALPPRPLCSSGCGPRCAGGSTSRVCNRATVRTGADSDVGQAVASGAMLACSFGTSPSTLTVAPTARVSADGAPAAAIMDHQPNVNIAPFGMCSSMSNPQVASATAAAQGVLAPQPCLPVTATPWTLGSPTVSIGGQPALSSASSCNCMWAGVITISNPGTRSAQVP